MATIIVEIKAHRSAELDSGYIRLEIDNPFENMMSITDHTTTISLFEGACLDAALHQGYAKMALLRALRP